MRRIPGNVPWRRIAIGLSVVLLAAMALDSAHGG